MDKKSAMRLLRQYVGEIAYLRKLPPKNQDSIHWEQKVRKLLQERFTSNSAEYKEFAGTLAQQFRAESDAEKQALYDSHLDQKKRALESIMEKHEKSRWQRARQRAWYEVGEFITSTTAKFWAQIFPK